jgi:hypothetical protein
MRDLSCSRRASKTSWISARRRSIGRGQDRLGQGSVVGREELLRRGRQVVDVARPADAVAAQAARDQAGRLEGSELLQDAGPARADALGDLIGRAGPPVRSAYRTSRRSVDEAPGPRRGRDQRRGRADSPLDHLGVGAVLERVGRGRCPVAGRRVVRRVGGRRRGAAARAGAARRPMADPNAWVPDPWREK